MSDGKGTIKIGSNNNSGSDSGSDSGSGSGSDNGRSICWITRAIHQMNRLMGYTCDSSIHLFDG